MSSRDAEALEALRRYYSAHSRARAVLGDGYGSIDKDCGRLVIEGAANVERVLLMLEALQSASESYCMLMDGTVPLSAVARSVVAGVFLHGRVFDVLPDDGGAP